LLLLLILHLVLRFFFFPFYFLFPLHRFLLLCSAASTSSPSGLPSLVRGPSLPSRRSALTYVALLADDLGRVGVVSHQACATLDGRPATDVVRTPPPGGGVSFVL
jgi:hypothetical protein